MMLRGPTIARGPTSQLHNPGDAGTQPIDPCCLHLQGPAAPQVLRRLSTLPEKMLFLESQADHPRGGPNFADPSCSPVNLQLQGHNTTNGIQKCCIASQCRQPRCQSVLLSSNYVIEVLQTKVAEVGSGFQSTKSEFLESALA